MFNRIRVLKWRWKNCWPTTRFHHLCKHIQCHWRHTMHYELQSSSSSSCNSDKNTVHIILKVCGIRYFTETSFVLFCTQIHRTFIENPEFLMWAAKGMRNKKKNQPEKRKISFERRMHWWDVSLGHTQLCTKWKSMENLCVYAHNHFINGVSCFY